MTIIDNGTTPSHDPAERDAILEAGWMKPDEPAPVAADDAAEELFGGDEDEGWNIGSTPAEPEPAPEASSVSDEYDYFRAANDTMDELTKQRDEARSQAVLQQAMALYGEGEDPVAIADTLRDNHGLETAARFVQAWQAEESDFEEDEDEDDGIYTPEEWAASEYQRLQAQANMAAMDSEIARVEEEAARQQEIRKAAETFQKRNPDVARHSDMMARLLEGVPMESADDVSSALELALRGAREHERVDTGASNAAEVLAEFDETIHHEQSFLPGAARPESFDRQQAVERNKEWHLERLKEEQGQAVNDLAIVPPATRKQIVEAQIDEELFGDERTFKAGWNLGVNTGQRKTEEYAHQRGLSPLSPEVQQYARKKNWL